MRNSEINFKVTLDEQNIPEQIHWEASDQGSKGPSETKSISISIWDQQVQNTMRIDLWTKEMPTDELKRFYIDTIGGLSQSLLNATGDEFMATEMNSLCERLVQHLKEENKQNSP